MARMPSAMAMPNAVAQLMTSYDVGWSFLVSMLMPAFAALVWALWICAVVSGSGVSISQPAVAMVAARPKVCTACSVITVLGAEVPGGRAPISWITGFLSTPEAVQGFSVTDPPPGRPMAFAGVPDALHHVISMPEAPANPGRTVKKSALGFTSDALIPNARRS